MARKKYDRRLAKWDRRRLEGRKPKAKTSRHIVFEISYNYGIGRVNPERHLQGYEGDTEDMGLGETGDSDAYTDTVGVDRGVVILLWYYRSEDVMTPFIETRVTSAIPVLHLPRLW